MMEANSWQLSGVVDKVVKRERNGAPYAVIRVAHGKFFFGVCCFEEHLIEQAFALSVGTWVSLKGALIKWQYGKNWVTTLKAHRIEPSGKRRYTSSDGGSWPPHTRNRKILPPQLEDFDLELPELEDVS